MDVADRSQSFLSIPYVVCFVASHVAAHVATPALQVCPDNLRLLRTTDDYETSAKQLVSIVSLRIVVLNCKIKRVKAVIVN